MISFQIHSYGVEDLAVVAGEVGVDRLDREQEVEPEQEAENANSQINETIDEIQVNQAVDCLQEQTNARNI